MPLTEQQLLDIQADAMADDIAIDMEKMALWTEADAVAYFESGGEVEPSPPPAAFTAPFTRGDAPTGATPWLACVEKKLVAKYRVVVFSWTGNRGGRGSAHNIRRVPVNWSKAVPDAEFYEVCYTGRSMRQKESLYTDASKLADDMAQDLSGALAGGKPFAFVGFSFGAVLAWEVALRINGKQPSEGPALLCAVSAEGPSWAGRKATHHTLGEQPFIDFLRRKGGTDIILKDAGMTRMYVPVIKADLALEETYRGADGRKAGVLTVAIVGKQPGRDQEQTVVKADDAQLWVADSSASGSKLVVLDALDWYVLQEEAGVNAVLAEVTAVMGAL